MRTVIRALRRKTALAAAIVLAAATTGSCAVIDALSALSRPVARSMTESERTAAALLAAWCPAESVVLDRFLSSGRKSLVDQLARSASEEDVLAALSTAVHEMYHATAWTPYPEAIWTYLDGPDALLVGLTRCSPAAIVAGLVPEPLRSSRYALYVATRDGGSTQANGFYGLLDEYYAYFHSMRTDAGLLERWSARDRLAPDDMSKLAARIEDDRQSRREFRYFILRYLVELERTRPAEFAAILGNANARRAFAAVDAAFEPLEREYRARIGDLVAALPSKGLAVRAIGSGDDVKYVVSRPGESFGAVILLDGQLYPWKRFDEALAAPELVAMALRLSAP